MTPQIRWMVRSDTDVVSEIRNECMVGSGRNLDRMLSSPSCILKVAVMDGRVSGFVSYKNSRKRIRIMEFAVSPEFRRKGIASELVGFLLQKASSSSKLVEATVPEQNLDAQLFLRKCGFKASKIVRSKNGPSYKFVMKCQKESS